MKHILRIVWIIFQVWVINLLFPSGLKHAETVATVLLTVRFSHNYILVDPYNVVDFSPKFVVIYLVFLLFNEFTPFYNSCNFWSFTLSFLLIYQQFFPHNWSNLISVNLYKINLIKQEFSVLFISCQVLNLLHLPVPCNTSGNAVVLRTGSDQLSWDLLNCFLF